MRAKSTATDPWRPLGRALLDFHLGRRKAAFVVHSELWEDEPTPIADYYRPDEQPLPELERRALALCRGQVLDLGAGAGRHALELERRGLQVTALDISEEAVEVMRSRGVRDPRRGDLFHLGRGSYDTVLLLMHGLGVVGTLAGLDRFLTLAQRLLTPGGQILCDSADLRSELIEAGIAPERLDPAGEEYYGEVVFRLSYRHLHGARYRWLFVDAATLSRRAGTRGFRTDIVTRGPRGGYLARLTRAGEARP